MTDENLQEDARRLREALAYMPGTVASVAASSIDRLLKRLSAAEARAAEFEGMYRGASHTGENLSQRLDEAKLERDAAFALLKIAYPHDFSQTNAWRMRVEKLGAWP